MTRFVDAYLPARVPGWPMEIGPTFSTQLVSVDSGDEEANRRWLDPLRQISIPDGVRDFPTFEDVRDHFLVMGGPFRTWPLRDPTDFASVPLVRAGEADTLDRTDQALGTGDGVTTRFQLKKRYTVGGENYDRDIRFPVVSSVLIGVDGVAPTLASPALADPTITRIGGFVDFATPPYLGAVLTAGFLFDIQVRYESDDTFRSIMQTYNATGFADIPLMEVRYCED